MPPLINKLISSFGILSKVQGYLTVMLRYKNRRPGNAGVTLIEIVIAGIIVAVLTVAFAATWMGSKTADHINRAAQQIYDDLIAIRSRAISVNAVHRLNFINDSQWQLEFYNEGTSAWETYGSTVRSMHSTVNLTAATLTNAAANLEAETSGLYNFQNSATGDPYVTIEGSGYSYTRSIVVAVGGAIEFETN